MKIELVVEYEGLLYHQPDCRLKVASDGGVQILIKKDGKFQYVKGEIVKFCVVEQHKS